MSFTGKLNAGMLKVSKIMKNSVDNCKLEGKIAEQKKIIKMLTKEIGNLVIVKLEEGEEMCPEIMERYEAIVEAKATIEELEKGRKTTKIVCQNCGAKSSAKMNFCGKCGAQLIKEDFFEEELEEIIAEVVAEEMTEDDVEETVEEVVKEVENEEK